jgi:tetratricopeptide (TPR) repeat protein
MAKPSQAIDEYKQSIHKNPDHYLAMYQLAQCYEKKGRYNAAKKWLLRVLKLQPEFEQAFKGLALISFKLGYYNDAAF